MEENDVPFEMLGGGQLQEITDLLRSHHVDQLVSFPQAVVVGDQSSGKSSVLSALARDIQFPSSSSLTTRCPCIVFMKNSEIFSASVSSGQEEKKSPSLLTFVKPSRLCKKKCSKVLTDERIVVRICGPKLVDLTLIGLPGIFRALHHMWGPARWRHCIWWMRQSMRFPVGRLSVGLRQEGKSFGECMN